MNFSLAAMIRAHCADSWTRAPSFEKRECDALQEKHGVPDGGGTRIPNLALRDLVVGTTTAGGFLAETNVLGYIDSLQPQSIALQLGATVFDVGVGGALIPRGSASVSTTWLATETSTATETQPTLAGIIAAPKILSAFTEISRQLLLQSNAEAVIRREFRIAAAASLDAGVLTGSGASGQPSGISTSSGTGAFTGTSLNRAALSNAQTDVNTANGILNSASCAYVTTPAVADLLANRADTIAEEGAVWKGALDNGTVLGKTARSTTGMTTGTMVYGDFTQVQVAQWDGGLQITIDPFTKFAQGIVGVRLLFPVDVVLRAPGSFSVSSSIT